MRGVCVVICMVLLAYGAGWSEEENRWEERIQQFEAEDGLHLSRAGYDVWNKKVRPHMGPGEK